MENESKIDLFQVSHMLKLLVTVKVEQSTLCGTI